MGGGRFGEFWAGGVGGGGGGRGGGDVFPPRRLRDEMREDERGIRFGEFGAEEGQADCRNGRHFRLLPFSSGLLLINSPGPIHFMGAHEKKKTHNFFPFSPGCLACQQHHLK